MKRIVIASALFFIGCKPPTKVFQYARTEKWSEEHAGDTNTLQTEYNVYYQGDDTLIYCTNYYTNGKLKSKVIHKNDGIWKIELVLDTLGNEKQFGKLTNGNGYVKQYNDATGMIENKGMYVNGNKEGWWKNYHFTGTIIDSILYKEGYDISSKAGNSSLEALIGPPGSLKNNLYR